ncbi:hypothetical protein FB45DRAFT_1001540 [Roridomyces roridus]|uniref:Uncharacterized protein n=1 Tax=Roridomyces roridus TaxID=1738132 RepID=A0AAD7C179_9AGAR|nr:hypothetical protein FB45DRAFT_1001540 [Roridomyces roridus]
MFPAIYTLVSATLFYIRAAILRFFGSRSNVNPAVTPYPLAPHLENCILDIHTEGASVVAESDADLEKGYQRPTPSSPHCSPVTRPRRSTLSVVTNLHLNPAVPAKKSKGRDENMALGLPFPATSPSRKSTTHRATLIVSAVPNSKLRSRASSASAVTSPLHLEAGTHYSHHPQRDTRTTAITIDWAARVHSVFYKPSPSDVEEKEDVRAVFNSNRDSFGIALGMALDSRERNRRQATTNLHVDWAARIHSVFYKKPEPGVDDSNVRAVFNTQDSIVSALALDGASDCDTSYDSTLSTTSKLAYLRPRCDSVSSVATTSSVTSTTTTSSIDGEFLKAVESKYPGEDWADIVRFEV